MYEVIDKWNPYHDFSEFERSRGPTIDYKHEKKYQDKINHQAIVTTNNNTYCKPIPVPEYLEQKAKERRHKYVKGIFISILIIFSIFFLDKSNRNKIAKTYTNLSQKFNNIPPSKQTIVANEAVKPKIKEKIKNKPKVKKKPKVKTKPLNEITTETSNNEKTPDIAQPNNPNAGKELLSIKGL